MGSLAACATAAALLSCLLPGEHHSGALKRMNRSARDPRRSRPASRATYFFLLRVIDIGPHVMVEASAALGNAVASPTECGLRGQFERTKYSKKRIGVAKPHISPGLVVALLVCWYWVGRGCL